MDRLLLEAIWWFLLLVVFYIYFGYPTLLWVLSRLKGERLVPIRDDFEPTVSLIIAAYNEERVLRNLRKRDNSEMRSKLQENIKKFSEENYKRDILGLIT